MSMLAQPVLVLNRLWQAVQVTTARRAFVLVYSGHAQIVDNSSGSYQTHDFLSWHHLSANYTGDDVVQTVTFRIRIPKIILLLIYDRIPKREVKLTRQNIYERDKNTCQYCGHKFDRTQLNLDHVIPREQGGKMTWENIVCSCIPCNTRKANRTPEQAGMRLIRKPERPKWRPALHATFTKLREESWAHFVDIAYWNVELGD
jgi:5-methylcytosine-specific restriction endonuclease McrA